MPFAPEPVICVNNKLFESPDGLLIVGMGADDVQVQLFTKEQGENPDPLALADAPSDPTLSCLIARTAVKTKRYIYSF